MGNRIKQLLKKEDGFTLVELLGVIIILGIILAIAVPSIGVVVDNARKNTVEAQDELIIDAAKLYELQSENVITEGGVTIENLIKEGYLENPKDTKVAERINKLKVIKKDTNGIIIYEITNKVATDFEYN